MMRILETQASNYNLAAGATVVTYAATALVRLHVKLDINGVDGGTQTEFTLVVSIDSAIAAHGEDVQSQDVAVTDFSWDVHPIVLLAGQVLTIELYSDNAADTSVSVTATIIDINSVSIDDGGLSAGSVADGAAAKVAEAASQITVTVPKRAAQQSLTPTRNLEQKAATQWTYAVEALGELPAGNAVYFTLKTSADVADSAAILQVRFPLDGATGEIGLIVLNGADPGAGRRGDASIAYQTYVEDAITYGRVIVTVEGEATSEVATGTYVWDIKSVGESDMELDAGSVQVKRPVTLAT